MPSPRHSTEDTTVESSTISTESPSATKSKDDAPYYCPGCGLRYEYRQKCTGIASAPHPPIEVVSTDELSGDPEKQTPAPNTDKLG